MKKLLLLTVFLLSGCAGALAPPPYNLTTVFSDGDFQPWVGQGSATLTGQAFLKTVGGEVKTCAGEHVTLLPATTYNEEVVAALRAGHENLANRSVGSDKYIRDAVCDAQGNFTFAGLPVRQWIVWANVQWGVPGGNGVSNQGGRLIKDVVLKDGQNQILLTDDDFLP